MPESAETTQIRIRLFGPITIRCGDRVLGRRDFGGVKPKQILEILLAARGRVVTKNRLADLLWEDGLPESPSATIEAYVSGLRRRLAELTEDGDDGRGAGLIVTESGGYSFDVSSVALDLDRFDELIDAAQRSEALARRAHLEEALGLIEGEVLEDEPRAGWAEALRGAYRARVLEARLDAAEAALLAGDPRAAVQRADQALATDPFAERGYRLKMLALYAGGHQHEALACFRDCRTRLRAQLGLEPMAETHAINSAILQREDPRSLMTNLAAPARLSAGTLARDPSAYENVFLIDPIADRILDTGAAAALRLGYRREELLGLAVSAIHPAEMGLLLELLDRSEQEGIIASFALTCRTRSGDVLPFEALACALHVEGRRLLLVIGRDPSDHRARDRPSD